MKTTFIVILTVLLSSCAMEISLEDFERDVRRHSSSTNATSNLESKVLYKGSDADFHYFKMVPKVGFPRSVKISKDELRLYDEFPYSDNEKKWLEYETVK